MYYRMKKYFITLAILGCAALTQAQTEFEAIKFAQTDIIGTARYMSMAGAFGALGGESSALRDNPAGLAIYRRSELTGTLGLNLQNSDASWLGKSATNNSYRVTGNNLALIIAGQTWRGQTGKDGLVQSNFAFTYNRIKDFNRSVTIRGGASTSSMTDFLASFTDGFQESALKSTSTYEPFDNENVPWLSILAYEGFLINPGANNTWSSGLTKGQTVTPSYKLNEKGRVDEYSFGWGGNFSNFFYLGATLNYQTINYSATTSYVEALPNNQSFNLQNSINTQGSGFNLRIGGILQPADYMRLGLSFQTPTIMVLKDEMSARLDYATPGSGWIKAPNASMDYQLQGPLQLNASTAFIFGRKGLLSLEYDVASYTGTRLRNTDGDADEFYDENEGIKTNFKNSATLKIGAEYRMTDNFSLRAGFANVSAITKSEAIKSPRLNTVRTDTEFFGHDGTNYFTAGFGYRESDWFLDFAYVNKQVKEFFVPYNSTVIAQADAAYAVTPAKVTTGINNIVVTLGLRF